MEKLAFKVSDVHCLTSLINKGEKHQNIPLLCPQ